MATQPPLLATWLLRYFGCGRTNDAVLGDLSERYQKGRTGRWYWKQVLLTIFGGYMRRPIAVASAVIVGLFLFLLQAQAQLTIHAASDQPVAGWQRMNYNNQAVWVSPTASLTSADILRAEPSTRDGGRAVGVIFNDAGAKKMTDLSHEQINKLIAMVLDGKVIFAPKVRAEIGSQALITGRAPNGLPAEVAQRIVQSVNRK